ncbi:MAG: poly-beta-1,6 N-acetyl-D-glucosamine export porin PgaA [Sulfuriferula sp.]|nr:poly-beta-1,6 N-acetyl-D-glucosamine export porin PgaA [Sulfuriferula sp.]
MNKNVPKRKLYLRLITASLIMSGIWQTNLYADNNTDIVRHQAIAQARAGQLDIAIQLLQKLHLNYPDDAAVTSDLIVLLRLAHKNTDIIQLTQTTPVSVIADYAVIPWAGAFRDEKDFRKAQAILVERRAKLGIKAQILYAAITLELGQTELAIAALPTETYPGLDADDFAKMAYVYRMAGNPTAALRLASIALARSPQYPAAVHEQVLSLSSIGAASMARSMAAQYPDFFTASELDYLQAEQTALAARNAAQEKQRLDNQGQYALSNVPLKQALRELDDNLIKFANDDSLLLRTRYDRIFVLRSMGMMQASIDEFSALKEPAPSYVRRAAADAYLQLHQPETAVTLYEDVIKANPNADVETYLGLYFAYVESEHYNDAERILTHLDKTTPAWHNDQAAHVERLENWERIDVDDQLAMDAIYRHQGQLAQQRIDNLVARAPRSDSLINTKATIERWRGLPLKAMETTKLAVMYAPDNRDTLVNLANNARDLEDYATWGERITALHQMFPDDNSVQIKNSYAQWLDRDRFSISSEYIYGTSRGNATNAVKGNQDQTLITTLYSPWTQNGWRGFLQQQYQSADYDTGSVNYNRVGVGAEWRWDRKRAWALLSDDQLTGNNVGIAGGWSQWLNDHWQYSISGDSYDTATPLLAKQAGLSGKSLSTRLTWRENEARSAYLNLSVLAISDGNKRYDLDAGFSQRLWANAHHITTGGIDIFAEHNTQPGGVYFNPANTQSVALRLEHEWLTWRRYERSFTQYFKLTAGMGQQTDFGSFPVASAYYEHRWAVSRTWEFHYGIGWSSQSYDGQNEQRTYGLIGFSGVF